MAQRTIELRFPASGVVRRQGHWEGFQSRQAYPTPWAVNVRPEDPFDFRLRGGSRPGLTTTTDNSPAGTVVYRDRLCEILNGGSVIRMSRQGDHTDFDYGSDVSDVGRSCLFQLSEAGETGENVIALISHKDAFLLAATADSLWVLSGDPVAGGTLRNISREVGIIAAGAWCKTENTIFFLSKRGLYAVQADGSGLKALSEELLPEELVDVDTSTVTVLLGYRQADNGVYVFLVGDTLHWFYDVGAGGFWPFAFVDSDHEPTAVYEYGSDLVLICADALARMIGGDDDDGEDIESHILIGPVRLAPGADIAVLSEFEGAMGESSGTVTWRIIVGDTAEEVAENGKTAIGLHLAGSTTAAAAYARYSGTFGAGRSRRFQPRLRGQWFAIWLSSTTKWAYEWIALRAVEAGRYR